MDFTKVARAGVRAKTDFLGASCTRLKYILRHFEAVCSGLKATPKLDAAILGVGVIEKRPMVVADEDGCDTIAIRAMSYFGIS